jgi:hypothetical protein
MTIRTDKARARPREVGVTRRRIAIAGLVCLIDCSVVGGANAEAHESPCLSGPYRQFDFWVGNWDVVEAGRPGVTVAHAHITRILGDCVVHELYEDTDGHRGESFSIFDATRGVWHQTWVNDRGDLLTIEGQLQGDTMRLQGSDHLSDGAARLVRGEWRPQGTEVREVAVRSTDGGRSWVPWFDLLFKPQPREK